MSRAGADRAYYEKNKEIILRKQAAYREKNKLKIKKYQQGYNSSSYGFYMKHVSYIKKTYGLSEQDVRDMMDSQSGMCPICKRSLEPGKSKGFINVDHCHVTGKVRGLLCEDCNLGLGHFNDDSGRLLNAVSYIKEKQDA